MKLPKRLKSGRRLVATAADGRVGLYCLGTVDEDGDYALLLPNGKIKRGMVGAKGYPLAPSGNWRWLRARKKRVRERREKKLQAIQRRSRNGDEESKKVLVSSIHTCVDCKRNMLGYQHSHTMLHERGYGVASICCRCARRRGGRCELYDRTARIRRHTQQRDARRAEWRELKQRLRHIT
jgi:hypothetical protein